MIIKSFHPSSGDFKKLLRFCLKREDFSRHIVVNIHGSRVMIFHSDRAASWAHVNIKKVHLFEKMYSKGKVDRFICCFPEDTGIPMDLCYMGKNAVGEISHSGDSNKVTFTCHAEERAQ